MRERTVRVWSKPGALPGRPARTLEQREMSVRLDPRQRADAESRPARGDAAPNAAAQRKDPMARLEMPPQSIENVRFGDGDGALQATGVSANCPPCERRRAERARQCARSDARTRAPGVDRVVEPGVGGYLRGDAKRGRKLLKSLGAAAKLALKLRRRRFSETPAKSEPERSRQATVSAVADGELKMGKPIRPRPSAIGDDWHSSARPPYGFCGACDARSGYSASSLASTPLVHPKPTCRGYSPPLPPLGSAPCSTSYFSTSTPVAA